MGFKSVFKGLNEVYSNNASAGLTQRPVKAVGKCSYSLPWERKEQEQIPHEQ